MSCLKRYCLPNLAFLHLSGITYLKQVLHTSTTQILTVAIAKDFISSLIVRDPRSRLTAIKCLEHPWLNLEIQTTKSALLVSQSMQEYNKQRKINLGQFTDAGFGTRASDLNLRSKSSDLDLMDKK
jgi:serine/threonine protein kinase